MQITLDIPDEISQEVVNNLLATFERQIQVAKKLASKSVLNASAKYLEEKQEDAQRWANYQQTQIAITQEEMLNWMDNLSKA